MSTVQSVDRALALLEYMSRRKEVSVTELSGEFALDKATVSRLMQTLEKHGFSAKSDVSAKYRMGSGVLQLSHNILFCNSMVRAARPALVELSDELGTTARLCMFEGNRVFIIDQVEQGRGKNNRDADIPGMSKPLYCSAIGKIACAYMQKGKLEALLKEMSFVAYTENTLAGKDELKRELQDIRACGYALNKAEYSDYAYCIAVPIFIGEEREVKYCIGITGWKDYREDPEKFERIINYMKRVSRAITENLSQGDAALGL